MMAFCKLLGWLLDQFFLLLSHGVARQELSSHDTTVPQRISSTLFSSWMRVDRLLDEVN